MYDTVTFKTSNVSIPFQTASANTICLEIAYWLERDHRYGKTGISEMVIRKSGEGKKKREWKMRVASWRAETGRSDLRESRRNKSSATLFYFGLARFYDFLEFRERTRGYGFYPVP